MTVRRCAVCSTPLADNGLCLAIGCWADWNSQEKQRIWGCTFVEAERRSQWLAALMRETALRKRLGELERTGKPTVAILSQIESASAETKARFREMGPAAVEGRALTVRVKVFG